MSSLRLSTQLQQKMVLTPQLRQRIEMLQMTSMELNELIEQEMVANPLLEEVQPGEEEQEISENILDQNSDGIDEIFSNGHDVEAGSAFSSTDADFTETFAATVPSDNGSEIDAIPEDPPEALADSGDSFEEIDFGREFQDYLDPGYKTQEVEYKEDAPSFEQFLTKGPSLGEHLEWQLRLLDIPAHLERAAINVIGNLDEDGRFVVDPEEVATASGCSAETVEKARSIVMSLEPVGCGAIDVKECLLAQITAQGEENTLASELVRYHFEDLQPHRLQHLSKATGYDVQTLNAELEYIKTLDPYPGRR
jgi:RNA polymerase sigma-54 factor